MVAHDRSWRWDVDPPGPTVSAMMAAGSSKPWGVPLNDRMHVGLTGRPVHVVDGPSDVLVVCHANITRSPLFAAMLAERWTPRYGVTVGSAGVRALVGSGPDPGSAVEAQVRGLTLAHHLARQVSAELVAAASLVLTMAEDQRRECVRLVPEAATRTFTVPEAVRLARHARPAASSPEAFAEAWHHARPFVARADEPEDVSDPHRGPLVAFVRLGMLLDGYAAVLTPPD